MEELTKLVAQKTGLSDEMAKVAVDTVINYLKDRLPEPTASQLDTILEGGDAADMMGGLGGLLGKK